MDYEIRLTRSLNPMGDDVPHATVSIAKHNINQVPRHALPAIVHFLNGGSDPATVAEAREALRLDKPAN
jgi:hypothetical protein